MPLLIYKIDNTFPGSYREDSNEQFERTFNRLANTDIEQKLFECTGLCEHIPETNFKQYTAEFFKEFSDFSIEDTGYITSRLQAVFGENAVQLIEYHDLGLPVYYSNWP
jgi:hypothetical protein